MAERNNLASTMRAMATSLERTPLDAKIEVVETACLKRGILVTADGYVRQPDAVALLGVSAGCLCAPIAFPASLMIGPLAAGHHASQDRRKRALSWLTRRSWQRLRRHIR